MGAAPAAPERFAYLNDLKINIATKKGATLDFGPILLSYRPWLVPPVTLVGR
jgi:hypothetical protein